MSDKATDDEALQELAQALLDLGIAPEDVLALAEPETPDLAKSRNPHNGNYELEPTEYAAIATHDPGAVAADFERRVRDIRARHA